MILWLLLSCAPPDACDVMCDAALVRYEGCMEEQGLEWGNNFADEADFHDWCDTWSWEQRQLGEEGRCEDMTPVFEDGTCAEWFDAW